MTNENFEDLILATDQLNAQILF